MVAPTTPPRARRAWDVLVLVAGTLLCLEAPLRLVLARPLVGWLPVYDLAATVILFADLVLHLRVASAGHNAAADRAGGKAEAFPVRWFLTDFLAAMPFDLLVQTLGAPGFLRMLVLARLLRVGRMAQFLHRRKEHSRRSPAILRLVIILFWIIVGTHLVACGWLALGSGNAADVKPGAEWSGDLGRYLLALYWTTTTITTIGYGDIVPVGRNQVVFTMFVQLLGAGIYGYIIGAIASLIANIDVAKSRHREQLEKVDVFMKYKGLPAETQGKVRDYYRYIWETRRGYDEYALINDFPAPLKLEILLFLNRAMIEKVPIFKGASPDFVRDIVLALKPVVFSPGEYVIRKGEVGHHMYFISRGAVDVVSEDGATVFATLREGNFFGEIALILRTPRTASIRAVGYTDLYELDKETFDRVLANYPEMKSAVGEIARQRREELPISSPSNAAE